MEQVESIEKGIDILEWQLPPEVLSCLLKDRTTDRNIVWGTGDYERLFGAGCGFGENDEILPAQVIDREHPIIRPRTVKTRLEQRQRSIDHAEVFTPAWVCNRQNNLVDAAWFGRKTSPFNVETKDPATGTPGWRTQRGLITRFPKGKSYLSYVFARRLEVACGEAPYLTSRYDAVTGLPIPVEDRIGLLDRKLRLVGENFTQWGPERWIEAARWALQSVYAFDWQGDNVLLARENLLFAVIEHFQSDFHTDAPFSTKTLLDLAEIISWNCWQMDGIRFVVPNSCAGHADMLGHAQPCPGCRKNSPWEHLGRRCRVMDWTTGRTEDFLPPSPKRLAPERSAP